MTQIWTDKHTAAMYTILFTTSRPAIGSIFHRQTPGHRLQSQDGRYQFYINGGIDDPDFWVVQNKGLREAATHTVAPENTILLTSEPRTVLVYPQRYLRQFGMVATSQEELRHPNAVYLPPAIPWFVGYTQREGKAAFSIDYDQLSTSPFPPKTKLLSVITSDKAFTQGHLERIRFVELLKAHFGDRMDVFGRGIRSFDDKWEVVAPYRYHIVIENSATRYYWTEKLADCYLAGAFPFYYGCTNVDDYFPREAYRPIDIRDAAGSIRTIEEGIASDVARRNAAALEEAKRRVLGPYNIFETIAALCDRLNPAAPKQSVTLRPCRSMDDWHNVWHYVVTQPLFKLRMRLTGGTHL